MLCKILHNKIMHPKNLRKCYEQLPQENFFDYKLKGRNFLNIFLKH